MNPIVMALLLLAGWGCFAYSGWRRWRLLRVGKPEPRFDRLSDRLQLTWKYAIAQLRMRRYPLAGAAHMLIFLGFGVLLLRTLILWGRGFDSSFDFWLFGSDQWPGKIYSLLKDVFALLVILGTLVFVYYRVVRRLPRMTLSTEGLVILGIIFAMMTADILYDGASLCLRGEMGERQPRLVVARGGTSGESQRHEVVSWTGSQNRGEGSVAAAPTATHRLLSKEELAAAPSDHASFQFTEPAGSVAALLLAGLGDPALTALKHVGFWTHSTLVLLFLNLLPYSKHFHVITGIPNVFFQSLHPPGRLPPIEDLDGRLERGETLGIRRIDQFSWKSILDFYTCTECGRCSDHCPATKTGKKLSPKHFTLDLRDFLYRNDQSLVAAATDGNTNSQAPAGEAPHLKDLTEGVIDPEVLWACTTCRACEQECPVFISYVDKIVDMRRYLVQEKSEFPAQWQTAFRGLESNANPWSFPASDRANWAEGMGVRTLADHPEADVLFWVGCAPSFDERAKKVTRATARLMQQAGVDFAILGTEEQCTGDPARAGNEYLFQMFARANVEILNGHGVDKKKIVTSCPHCFNTLKNEYPDFGGRYEVIHHSTFLADLVAQGKIRPTKSMEKRVVFHDSCYLGRYNEVYDAPREALRSIPGITLVEPTQTRDRGMCCGAGGAQMFKEEEPGAERVNIARTRQLLETKPDAVSSACPFCMRMLTDGLAAHGREEVAQLDIAELLAESVESP